MGWAAKQRPQGPSCPPARMEPDEAGEGPAHRTGEAWGRAAKDASAKAADKALLRELSQGCAAPPKMGPPVWDLTSRAPG